MHILVINLGSTSTKIAVYDGNKEVFVRNIEHDSDLSSKFNSNLEQLEFRKAAVLEEVKKEGYDIASFTAVCSRGGPLKPVASGTYIIDENVTRDAADPKIGGRHASSLGLLIANDISKKYGIPAYFTDPVSTDELIDEARISGLKGMERNSMFHALNQKSAARKAADMLGKPYEELNIIGVHMGGGVSVVAHRHGRVIDNYNVIDDGCFSMDRPGNLPTTSIIDLCFSEKSKKEVVQIISSKAGVYSYLGTKDFREVERRVKSGDMEATQIFNAMVYQHIKSIGSMAAAMCFEIDAIVLTGGIAYSRMMCDGIKSYVGKLAQIIEIPGENEMQSLAEGTLRVLAGEMPKVY